MSVGGCRQHRTGGEEGAAGGRRLRPRRLPCGSPAGPRRATRRCGRRCRTVMERVVRRLCGSLTAGMAPRPGISTRTTSKHRATSSRYKPPPPTIVGRAPMYRPHPRRHRRPRRRHRHCLCRHRPRRARRHHRRRRRRRRRHRRRRRRRRHRRRRRRRLHALHCTDPNTTITARQSWMCTRSGAGPAR